MQTTPLHPQTGRREMLKRSALAAALGLAALTNAAARAPQKWGGAEPALSKPKAEPAQDHFILYL